MSILSAIDIIHARFAAASNRKEAFDAASSYADNLGFSNLIYAPVRNHPDSSNNWSLTSYPEEWQKIYVEKGYIKTNPTRRKAALSFSPFTWSELESEISAKERSIFHDCRATGMREGLVVPVHGPCGQAIAIGFATQHAEAVNPESKPMLQLIALQLHHAFDVNNPQDPVRLTPREREVLMHITEGAGNDEIGARLFISDNSVEWHLKNIFRKLEVSNRTAAVVKALRLGLIPF